MELNLETAIHATKHPLRQSIIEYIEANEPTVTDIENKFQLRQSVASLHLKILRDAGIIYNERDGRFRHYKVNGLRLIFLGQLKIIWKEQSF